MYLTEELFETADADHPYYSPSKQAMDQHNPQQHSPDHLGKRKRGAAADEYTPNTVPIKNIKISSTHHFVDYPAAPPPPTHVFHATTTTTPDPTTLYPSPPRRKPPRVFAHPRRTTHTRSPLQAAAHQHADKAAHPRTTTSSHAAVAPPATTTTTTTTTTSSADLTPCHHCRRSPKQKKELENYLSCADCGARTCFICARVCERGRQRRGRLDASSDDSCAGGDAERKICCECCVERGEEGETWCLRCVQEGGDDDDDDGIDEDMVMG